MINKNGIIPTLTLIRGLPGSGKSTYAGSLLKKGMKHFEADMFHTKNGIYNYQVSRAREGHEWCISKTRQALARGHDVIVSNTFTTSRELAPYLDMADELGLEVRIIKCTGEFGSDHGVPDEVLQTMSNRWENIEGEEVYTPD